MSGKVRSALIVGLLVTVGLIGMISFETETASAGAWHFVGGTGPGNHTSIQDAIDAASIGDTVYVYSGTYYEQIAINKTLSLIGEDKNSTKIDGGRYWNVIHITADWVNVTGITATKSGEYEGLAGIKLDNARNCTIIDTNMSSNYCGILVHSSDESYIANNTVLNNYFGIMVDSSCCNIITNNTANSNTWYGIYTFEADSNTIVNNTASDNWAGIYIDYSTNSDIKNNTMMQNGITIYGEVIEHWNTHAIDISNTVNGKPVHYWKNQTGGTVPQGAGEVILANCTNVVVENQNIDGGSNGIQLGFSHGNTIGNCTVSNSWYGIYLYFSDDNAIEKSKITSNLWVGIYFIASCNNHITDSTVRDNLYGVYIEPSLMLASKPPLPNSKNIPSHSKNIPPVEPPKKDIVYGPYGPASGSVIRNNTIISNELYGIYLYKTWDGLIYHNNFIDNTNYDDGINLWNSSYPTGGNYWENWVSPDADGDGFVDYPYSISGGENQDCWPFTEENEWLPPLTSGPIQNIDTGEYFSTFRAAIADPQTLGGHTIEVSAGTYYENVVIDKNITLKGENQDDTVINGGGKGDVAHITADGVDITGFTVTGSGGKIGDAGIELNSVENCHVSNITSSGNNYGIYLEFSRNCTVTNNNASSNVGYGISLGFSGGNYIFSNTVSNNANGMRVYYSDSNSIFNNTASNNVNGIRLYESKTNTIYNNEISSNTEDGISLYTSSFNEIYHNSIMDNTNQAYDNDVNFWNASYPTGGNYWSDYSGEDEFSGPEQDLPGSDGFGDASYIDIGGGSGAEDHYPQMTLGFQGATQTVPTAPQNPRTTSGNRCVNLTWDAPSNRGNTSITNHIIYRGNESGNLTLFTTIGNVLYFNDTYLENGRTYYYEISAVNVKGEGARSAEVNATPMTVPTAPQKLVALGGDGYVYLSWEAPVDDGGSDVTNYTIYRGRDSGNLTLHTTTKGNTLHFNDTSVVNETYHYRIGAVNGVGEGLLSNEANATPLAVHAEEVDTTPVDIADSDKDGLLDSWEMEHFGDLSQGAWWDFDGDGLSNLEEYELGTDPDNKDTDGDGILDVDDDNPLEPLERIQEQEGTNINIILALLVVTVFVILIGMMRLRRRAGGAKVASYEAEPREVAEKTETVECPFCGAMVSDDYIQCPECDSPLTEDEDVDGGGWITECSFCGAVVPSGSTQCPECDMPTEGDVPGYEGKHEENIEKAVKTIECSFCGAVVSSDSNLCIECDAPLMAEKKAGENVECSFCGAVVPSGSTQCPECDTLWEGEG